MSIVDTKIEQSITTGALIDARNNPLIASWELSYGQYDKQKQLDKVSVLYDLARTYFHSSEVDDAAQTTYEFINNSFDIYNGDNTTELLASFGFIVPTRIRRDPSDYDDESLYHAPILQYFDTDTRQKFAATMCPYIADRYGIDTETGRRGYMIFVPLFMDMVKDLSPTEIERVARKIIDDGVGLASGRLDAEVIGLGASIPGITMFGRTIPENGFVTTTGHGGTINFVGKVILSALEDQVISEADIDTIGFIGAGAIGGATAEYILETGICNNVLLRDVRDRRVRKVAERLSKMFPRAGVEILTTSDQIARRTKTIVSALEGSINLDAPGWKDVDLEGLKIIEDTVPPAFDLAQLKKRGGEMLFVIGEDNTEDGLLTGEGFKSGGSSFAEINHTWGCGAEVCALAKTRRHDLAIRGPVNSEQIANIGKLFDQVGIGVAPLQRFGEFLPRDTIN